MSGLLQQLNDEMADMVERVRRSLVQVISDGRSGGAGAGTIWHPDGLIVTNAHVVRRGRPRVTLADGHTLPARLLAHDEGRDLAALAVDAYDLSAIELGDSGRLQPGQWVFALGHPWGVVGAVAAGVVIGVGEKWSESFPSSQEWIAVSLPLRPGNSGGPLIDVQGRLVAINSMMTGPGVGVAVPVQAAKAFLREALGSPKAVA